MKRNLSLGLVIGGVLLAFVGNGFAGDLIHTEANGYFKVWILDESPTHFMALFTGWDFPVNTELPAPVIPPQFDWFIDQSNPGIGDGFFDEASYVGANWTLSWQIQGFGNDAHVPDPKGPGGIDGKEIVPVVGLQHREGPHAGEEEGSLNIFAPYWITNGNPAPGQPIPYIGVEFLTDHPGLGQVPPHTDDTWIEFFGEADTWNFVEWNVMVEGTHVPAPGAAVLGAIGLGLIWIKRKLGAPANCR